MVTMDVSSVNTSTHMKTALKHSKMHSQNTTMKDSVKALGNAFTNTTMKDSVKASKMHSQTLQ